MLLQLRGPQPVNNTLYRSTPEPPPLSLTHTYTYTYENEKNRKHNDKSEVVNVVSAPEGSALTRRRANVLVALSSNMKGYENSHCAVEGT